MELTLTINKRVQNTVLGYNFLNDRMILVHFRSKPFNITVIQLYAPTPNAEDAEINQLYEELMEKAMAPHSSTPAWKIPWMEEPCRLESMGSRRVRHD